MKIEELAQVLIKLDKKLLSGRDLNCHGSLCQFWDMIIWISHPMVWSGRIHLQVRILGILEMGK